METPALTSMFTGTPPSWFVARVRGDDPLAFLHAVTTQDVSGLTPGDGTVACVLDDKGRIEAEVRITVLRDGSVLLDGEPASRAAIVERVARIAPLSGCEIIDESDRWTVELARGPGASEMFEVAREHSWVEVDDGIAIKVEWLTPGFDVLTPRTVPSAPGSWDEVERDRIVRGRPRFGVDIAPGTLVNETPLLARAVSFTKGCYPGQESVARVHNLGRARTAVVALTIDGVPASGDAVLRDEASVGTVTSVTTIDGTSYAIATVRAEAVGDDLTVAGTRARARRIE